MKKTFLVMLVMLLLVPVAVVAEDACSSCEAKGGCGSCPPPADAAAANPAEATPAAAVADPHAGHDHAANPHAAAPAAAPVDPHAGHDHAAEPHDTAPTAPAGPPVVTGKVVETMNSGGYTYVCVAQGEEKIWAAGPETKVAVGDEVTFVVGMMMVDFHSKTLKKDFAQIYFVDAIAAPGAVNPAAATGVMPPGHPVVPGAAGHGAPKVEAEKITGIDKADHTVADVFAKKAELKDTSFKIRGQVVKVNNGIMGKNWLHVQDGSGAEGTNDLTVTTQMPVTMGTVVVVEGKLTLDKDFGAGYKYQVIMEDAKVTVERAEAK